MKLILIDTHPMLYVAWQKHFKDLPNVEIIEGRFEEVADYDCMVSPANSFGLMDGGIDAAITNYFGDQLQKRVQAHILKHYLGEQSVGTSFIIETNHSQHPYLAHTPTMRVPLRIIHSDNVYKAMWAMLLAVYQHNQTSSNPIKSVLCPGLGTGVGRVPHQEAARQMALAYQHYLNPPERIDWRMADERQMQIRYGGDSGLLIPPETE